MDERVEASEHADELLERHGREPARRRRSGARRIAERRVDGIGGAVPGGREVGIVGGRGSGRQVGAGEERPVHRHDVADEVAHGPRGARRRRIPLVVADAVDARAETRGHTGVPLGVFRHRP